VVALNAAAPVELPDVPTVSAMTMPPTIVGVATSGPNRDVRQTGNIGAGIENYTAGASHRKQLVVDTPCRWGIIVQAA